MPLLPDPEDPSPGDVIYLIDEDGHMNGQMTRVRRLVSEDFDGQTFEVVDAFNQTRYIKPLNRDALTWREVFI